MSPVPALSIVGRSRIPGVNQVIFWLHFFTFTEWPQMSSWYAHTDHQPSLTTLRQCKMSQNQISISDTSWSSTKEWISVGRSPTYMPDLLPLKKCTPHLPNADDREDLAYAGLDPAFRSSWQESGDKPYYFCQWVIKIFMSLFIFSSVSILSPLYTITKE